MARLQLRHIDCTREEKYVLVEKDKLFQKEVIKISIYCTKENKIIPVILDKSTAIKFAKTLRTEINKITEQ